ncbi:Coronatine-insensitive protein 1 [Forsythia ovata]|uniref:Coronatine-insensitive protein 1 n=1 Tax=Forsythia ovata TaxID=205694 RepID=A0ABD1P4J8_9LAMI
MGKSPFYIFSHKKRKNLYGKKYVKTKRRKRNLNEIGISTSNKDHTVWDLVIPYIQDPQDRAAVSLVCPQWCHVDAITRRHVTIDFCHTAAPDSLFRRFPLLNSLEISGCPPDIFGLIFGDWKSYITPWLREIADREIKALDFQRMIVNDSDLDLLATSVAGKVLEVLKLNRCSGFSTDGLLHIVRSCGRLRTLSIEGSYIIENDGEWLHELALRNTTLENLNFFMSSLVKIRRGDLELIARNCASLVSMKIGDCDVSDLNSFFHASTVLEEFAGSYIYNANEVKFPPRLCRLNLNFMHYAVREVIPVASRFIELDLRTSHIDREGHCLLLKSCPNLKILKTTCAIGDSGLVDLAQFCKRMKKLRIYGYGECREARAVTERGLIALSMGCRELEYLTIYGSNITNDALECVGRYLKNLCDLRLVLIKTPYDSYDIDASLDNGIRLLLMGCPQLRRFDLFLHERWLTDKGFEFIGRYGKNVKWMRFGNLRVSEEGISKFFKHCTRLQKLEMWKCQIDERALGRAVRKLTSLKYLWVEGTKDTSITRDLARMLRKNWMVELIPSKVTSDGLKYELVTHLMAYRSLVG